MASKLDLHWGFHEIQMYANVCMQIESESERDITTFATDDRISDIGGLVLMLLPKVSTHHCPDYGRIEGFAQHRK